MKKTELVDVKTGPVFFFRIELLAFFVKKYFIEREFTVHRITEFF